MRQTPTTAATKSRGAWNWILGRSTHSRAHSRLPSINPFSPPLLPRFRSRPLSRTSREGEDRVKGGIRAFNQKLREPLKPERFAAVFFYFFARQSNFAVSVSKFREMTRCCDPSSSSLLPRPRSCLLAFHLGIPRNWVGRGNITNNEVYGSKDDIISWRKRVTRWAELAILSEIT